MLREKSAYNRDLLYGLPHIRCHYKGKSVNSHTLNDDAECICCGRTATNAHHYPPKGTAPVRHRNGFELKPPLFAVCGSGTTGCHNEWHGGARYEAWWAWDDADYEREWESGALLLKYGAHSPKLYKHGRWMIHDKQTGIVFTYGGE